MEVARDLQQCIEHQWPRLSDSFLHRQDAHEVIAHPQMVAFGFEIGIDDLEIQELGVLRIPRDPPVIKVQEPAEEPELTALIQDLDRYEVNQLANKGVYLLFEKTAVALDLRPQQSLHSPA